MRRQALTVFALLLVGCAGEDTVLPAVGTLERDRVEVVAEAHEVLLEIHVREGQFVGAGELLARQEDARMKAAVAGAEAAALRATRRVDELVRGPRHEAVDEARAALDGARAREAAQSHTGALAGARDSEAVAVREHARARELQQRGLASEAEVDSALRRRDTAVAERRQRDARLAALLDGTTAEELDQALAARAEAEASLAAARLSLERLALRAPREGTVDAIPYKLGARPPAGATVVVLLVGDAPHARVYVPQAVRARLRVGSPATVRVPGVPESFAGEVRAIAAEAAFTPYYALTERDRDRLVYVTEVALAGAAARELPAGLPVEVVFPPPGAR